MPSEGQRKLNLRTSVTLKLIHIVKYCKSVWKNNVGCWGSAIWPKTKFLIYFLKMVIYGRNSTYIFLNKIFTTSTILGQSHQQKSRQGTFYEAPTAQNKCRFSRAIVKRSGIYWLRPVK